MSLKTLVACMTDREAYGAALQTAASIAEQKSGHLSVLCLGIDRTNPGVYYAGAQAITMQSNMEEAQADALAAEEAAHSALGPWSIPFDTQSITTQIGALAPVIGERTQLSDLVVLPKPYGGHAGTEDVVILEAVLFQTRVPVLVLPEGMSAWTPPKRVVIAWNQSPEALSAVKGAIGFLAAAETVDIAIIDPPQHTSDRSDPGGALAEMLSRHGVHASISVLARTMPRISEVLARHCEDREADMIVMGAYGHSRLREAILGGATRNMLEIAAVPVLMAH